MDPKDKSAEKATEGKDSGVSEISGMKDDSVVDTAMSFLSRKREEAKKKAVETKDKAMEKIEEMKQEGKVAEEDDYKKTQESIEESIAQRGGEVGKEKIMCALGNMAEALKSDLSGTTPSKSNDDTPQTKR